MQVPRNLVGELGVCIYYKREYSGGPEVKFSKVILGLAPPYGLQFHKDRMIYTRTDKNGRTDF